MQRVVIIITLGLALAGCDDGDDPDPDAGSEGCDVEGCDDGFRCDSSTNECVEDCTVESCAESEEYCNPDTGLCEFDCTLSGCEDDLVCNEETRQCQDRCSDDGCEDDTHCDATSGVCEPDCTEDSCNDDQWCNEDSGVCEDGVVFEDENLEACVREYLELGEGPILPPDVEEFTHLECQDRGIETIAGLEYFIGLEDLTLWENDIEDISPLENLTNLERLQLGNNQISDLSPLTDLMELTALGLSINDIEELSPLEALTGLNWLNLDHNRIDDLGSLSNLENLTWFTVEGNDVSGNDLDDMVEIGADMYWMHIDEAAGAIRRRATASDPVSSSEMVASGPAERPIFNFTTDDDGVVTFEYLVGGVIYEARHEFEGDILFDGRHFLYRVNGAEQPIGEVVDRDLYLCSGAYEHICDFSRSRRFPTALEVTAPGLNERALEPVFTVSLALRQPMLLFDPPADENYDYGTYHALMDPFVLASPNQFDAGSCLFMANTGAMEILLNQHTPIDDISYEGDTDLSERFLMNASNHVPSRTINYYITDTTYTYNAFGGSLLNRDYRFAAGYVKDTSRGLVVADESDPDAYFSCSYSWIDELPDGWEDTVTETPEVERTLIFVDPNLDDNSIWNVGLMNEDVVERIKYELRTKRAPVIVVYNHFLYWHADIVVGYDDARSIGECPMVRDSLDYYEEQGATGYVRLIEDHMDEEGGCFDEGVFYVRDSIYEGSPDDITYSYSDQYNFREPYSDRIITRSYDWVRYLSNHAYTVHRR